MSSPIEKGSRGTGTARASRPAQGRKSGKTCFSADGRDPCVTDGWGAPVYSVLWEENSGPSPSPCTGEVYIPRPPCLCTHGVLMSPMCGRLRL